MSGRHSFRKLREKIERDPERRERMDEKKKAYDAILNLAELREANGLTQAKDDVAVSGGWVGEHDAGRWVG